MPDPDSIRIISVVAFFVCLVMGLKKSIWAVVAYMILVYCKLSEYYPVFGAIRGELTFAVLILAKIALAGGHLGNASSAYSRTNKQLYIFIFCVFISFLVAIDKQVSWDASIYHFIKVMILYIMIISSLEKPIDIKIFIYSFLTLFLYLGYEPMYGFLTETSANTHSYGEVYIAETGILAGHVALANNMNQMIPISLYLSFIKKKMVFIFSSLATVVFLTAVVGSKSRGGVVGLCVIAGCYIYFSEKRSRDFLVLCVLAFCLVAVYPELLDTGSRIGGSDEIFGRFTGLTHGIGMFLKGNILGVGPGCFPLGRSRYFSYTMASHNIYGEMIGTVGLPGTIAWFYFIRQVFYNCIEAKKNLIKLSMESGFLYYAAIGIQVSLIVRLAISMASHGLLYFYWYVLAAVSIAIKKQTDLLKSQNSIE